MNGPRVLHRINAQSFVACRKKVRANWSILEESFRGASTRCFSPELRCRLIKSSEIRGREWRPFSKWKSHSGTRNARRRYRAYVRTSCFVYERSVAAVIVASTYLWFYTIRTGPRVPRRDGLLSTNRGRAVVECRFKIFNRDVREICDKYVRVVG